MRIRRGTETAIVAGNFKPNRYSKEQTFPETIQCPNGMER